MFAQTVGIKTAAKVGGPADMFLSAMLGLAGDGTAAEGALNLAAWNMIRDLVGSDPALNQAAWESLRGIVGLLPAATGTEGSRRRVAAGIFRVLTPRVLSLSRAKTF